MLANNLMILNVVSFARSILTSVVCIMERCFAILVILGVSTGVERLTMGVPKFKIGTADTGTARIVTIITTLSLISSVTFGRCNSD